MSTPNSTTEEPEKPAEGPPSAPVGWDAWFRMRYMTPRQRKMLALLAVAELFENYDAAIVSIAMLQIQAGLQIPESQIGAVAGAVRLGMLGSFAITLFADRFGRRRLLLLTVLGFSLFTGLTAFAETAQEFVIAQLVARAFIGAELMLGSVVIIEELAARDRGWGLGVLGALASLGYGLCATLFAFIDVLPGGWRFLYGLGALPLLVLAWLRRELPETDRFERYRESRAGRQGWREMLRPVRNLAVMYPSRMASLSAFVISFDFVHWTVFGFLSKTMQEVHGFTLGNIAVLMVVAGTLGVTGHMVAGVMSDLVGRKKIMAGMLGIHVVSSAIFYNSSGFSVVASWVGIIFAATGLGVLIKALGSELFPTSYRSTAAGMRLAMATLGGGAGYYAESMIYPYALASLGGTEGAAQLAHAVAITWMLPLLLVPLLLLATIPETAGRELEEIAPERVLDGDAP